MSGNTIGKMFRVTSFGESHGTAVGCVIDGMPPNFTIDTNYINKMLARRKPGSNRQVSQRREQDEVQIISGVFDGKSTGTPICLLINNVDPRERDYQDIANKFRPGHGDYSYYKKYGIYDYRGGGRASARETVARVAAGAIAKKYLEDNYAVSIRAALTELGEIKAESIDYDAALNNEFNFADSSKISYLEQMIKQLRTAGDSTGGIVSLELSNVPAGLGEPVYDKIDATLARALMSINAVKGVEFGAGFAAASMLGSENNDELQPQGFKSNNAGGMLAGITTGQDITARLAFKPTPSIRLPQATLDYANSATEIKTHGRHDICVAIRAVAIVEAMAAMVLLDHVLCARAQVGVKYGFNL